jgi:hypothetical protein
MLLVNSLALDVGAGLTLELGISPTIYLNPPPSRSYALVTSFLTILKTLLHKVFKIEQYH